MKFIDKNLHKIHLVALLLSVMAMLNLSAYSCSRSVVICDEAPSILVLALFAISCLVLLMTSIMYVLKPKKILHNQCLNTRGILFSLTNIFGIAFLIYLLYALFVN